MNGDNLVTINKSTAMDDGNSARAMGIGTALLFGLIFVLNALAF